MIDQMSYMQTIRCKLNNPKSTLREGQFRKKIEI
jgi:hypothetical protein